MEVEDEGGLESKIPGEVVQHRPQREAFSEIEEPENDPICQPLDVIIVTRTFEGLDGKIGGERPTEQIGDGRGKCVDSVQHDKEDETTEESVALGHLRALLEVGQEGIFV